MSDVDDFLAHYGIPGMKWGKHKQKLAPHSSIKPSQHAYNKRAYGAKSAAKINESLHSGATLTDARKQEVKRRNKNTMIKLGVVSAGALALHYGPTVMGVSNILLTEAVMAKKSYNGKRYASRLLADSRGITNYSTIRMQQDPTTGNWG